MSLYSLGSWWDSQLEPTDISAVAQSPEFQTLESWVIENYSQIRKESLQMYHQIPSMNISQLDHAHAKLMSDTSAWNVIWLKYLGKKISSPYPILNQLIESDLIYNATISIVRPGGTIPTHRGQCQALLKYHIPIQIPVGDVGIEYCGQTYRWTSPLLFDDTQPHRVWNRTTQDRIILLFDLYRPMGLWSILNQRVASLAWLTPEAHRGWALIGQTQQYILSD